MTALSLVQAVCMRIGIPKPSTAVSSTDTQVLQIVALANEEGKELTKRPSYGWTAMQSEAAFTTVATEIQGAVATIAPGLDFIINDTIWNRSLTRPVFGPLTPQRWQQQKASNVNGPWNQYRIRGPNILFIPAPAAGQSCYFEYVSKNWCTDSTGATTRAEFLQDEDLVLLDEDIMVLGVIWRWKAAKGLEYAEDFNKYERQVLDSIATDGAKDVLKMGSAANGAVPGVVVPDGSWMQ